MTKLINKLINQGQEYLLAWGGSKEGDKIEYVTEEEYEALTPEQKSDEDTTYMITGEGEPTPTPGGDIINSLINFINHTPLETITTKWVHKLPEGAKFIRICSYLKYTDNGISWIFPIAELIENPNVLFNLNWEWYITYVSSSDEYNFNFNTTGTYAEIY